MTAPIHKLAAFWRKGRQEYVPLTLAEAARGGASLDDLHALRRDGLARQGRDETWEITAAGKIEHAAAPKIRLKPVVQPPKPAPARYAVPEHLRSAFSTWADEGEVAAAMTALTLSEGHKGAIPPSMAAQIAEHDRRSDSVSPAEMTAKEQIEDRQRRALRMWADGRPASGRSKRDACGMKRENFWGAISGLTRSGYLARSASGAVNQYQITARGREWLEASA